MTENATPVYLNTAACGLISPSVLEAGTRLYTGFEANSSATAEHWRDVEQLRIKENIAGFIGARADSIALIPNFSFGLNTIVHALNGGEKVLLYKKDFPSVYAPFVINNFNIVWLDNEADGFTIDLNKIESIIPERFRAPFIKLPGELFYFQIALFLNFPDDPANGIPDLLSILFAFGFCFSCF